MLIKVIAAGDPDAVAGFFDARAPSVRAYCTELCAEEVIDEATLAAFVDFLGRLGSASPDTDPADLLHKGTRSAAASRMHIPEPPEPTCRSIPELIAARANGELQHDEGPMQKHLERCKVCRRSAERLTQAEDALVRSTSELPPETVRAAWLDVAAREVEPAEAPEAPEAQPLREAAPDPVANAEDAGVEDAGVEGPRERALDERGAQTAEQTVPATPAQRPVLVRRRRGGLIGTARRLLSDTHRGDSSS